MHPLESEPFRVTGADHGGVAQRADVTGFVSIHGNCDVDMLRGVHCDGAHRQVCYRDGDQLTIAVRRSGAFHAHVASDVDRSGLVSIPVTLTILSPDGQPPIS